MKHLAAALIILSLPAVAGAQWVVTAKGSSMPDMESTTIGAVSPALQRYAKERIFGDVWKRTDLTLRDRSLVTVAALVATGQPHDLPSYVETALQNGVKPTELSETITHLAFYAGWPNAISAVEATSKVFAQHGISATQLPPS